MALDRQPMWTFRGQVWPPFALEPGAGQESVWDYPRPPRIEADARRIEVKHAGKLIASATANFRVLETASPPTYYVPQQAVDRALLRRMPGSSYCEWKGAATYWALAGAESAIAVGWSYENPLPAFVSIRGYLSFYPARVECYVADERVTAQAGGFYGGWITAAIVGPFKGDPGTAGW
ncbi:MAG: DUF427 domain-containing protein [Casimicrobiaceae bacterium]